MVRIGDKAGNISIVNISVKIFDLLLINIFGGADVIFGEEGDSILLGAFILGALGLALDPLRREFRNAGIMDSQSIWRI